jgi:hypothetical protein
LLKLVAAADNQLIIIPVEKDNQGRTVVEVRAYGKGEALKAAYAFVSKSCCI